MPAFINKDNSEFKRMHNKISNSKKQILRSEYEEDVPESIVEILQRERGRDREERDIIEEIQRIIISSVRIGVKIQLIEQILQRERRRRRRNEMLEFIERILVLLRIWERDRDRNRDRRGWDRLSEKSDEMLESEKMIEHPKEMPEIIKKPEIEMPEIIHKPISPPEQMPVREEPRCPEQMPIWDRKPKYPQMPVRDEKPHCPGQMPAHSAKDEMMNKIMSVQFMVLDIALYLDTHPCDTAMINKHNFYADMLRGLIADYERTFNEPLTIYGISPADRWAWVSEKWPWNKCDIMRKEC
ncbi:MAG: spore coat protein CotJB [Eubacteriaceae bacterium]